MSELSYLTRGADTPTDKTNILLLSHPSDTSRAVDTVGDDVLLTLDVALWYFKDGCDGDAHLDEMNLVIIPVTETLIFDFAPVRVVYTAALERGIPVLPILIERVSVEDYERCFGTVQYLDRASEDSPLNYNYQLREYLSAFEASDGLRKRIASELDATVFLSYRHIDRAQATRLMRAIHDLPHLRDVAIWYDDQLTAGKNYNDEILESVRESDLFVLAVTPNVLDDGNYVLEREYPAALAASVPVLPVEMVQTSAEELSRKYAGIPETCTLDTLGDRMCALLGDKLNRENDADAEHLYYVGLAYTMGVSVEIDKERGIKLLKHSARLGCPDAIRRLAAIYWSASGDTRDISAARTYAEEYTRHYEELFEAESGVSELLELEYAYSFRLTVMSGSFSTVDADVIERYLAIVQTLCECHPGEYSTRKMVDALCTAARYYSEIHFSEASGNCYALAVAGQRKLYEADGETRSLIRLVELLVKLARSKADGAHEYITEALALLDTACDTHAYDDRRIREAAADAYAALGEICYKSGSYDDGAQACRRAIDLYDGLSAHSHAKYLFDSLAAREKLIENYIGLGRFDEAEAMICDLEQRISSLDGWFENYRIDATLCKATLELERKDYPSAEKFLEQAEALVNGLGESNGSEKNPYAHLMESYAIVIAMHRVSLYNAWGRPHLADAESADILRRETELAIERGAVDDYKALSRTYSILSTNALLTKSSSLFGLINVPAAIRSRRWRRYSALASEGRVEFYPDGTHLERERDAHLRGLLGSALGHLAVWLVLLSLLLVDRLALGNLDWNWVGTAPVWLKACFWLWVSVMAGLRFAVYVFFALRRKRAYSENEVFEYAKRTKDRVVWLQRTSVCLLLPILVLILIFINELLAMDFAAMPVIAQLSLTMLFAWCILERATSTWLAVIDRERDRAFLRISRLKPLPKQPLKFDTPPH